jgi:hypothetical protein
MLACSLLIWLGSLVNPWLDISKCLVFCTSGFWCPPFPGQRCGLHPIPLLARGFLAEDYLDSASPWQPPHCPGMWFIHNLVCPVFLFCFHASIWFIGTTFCTQPPNIHTPFSAQVLRPLGIQLSTPLPPSRYQDLNDLPHPPTALWNLLTSQIILLNCILPEN